MIDLTGKRFNKIIVLKYDHNDKCGNSYWQVLCDCGKRKIVSGNNLMSQRTKSCGCLRKRGNFKHGMTKTSIYKRWSNMKRRCFHTKSTHYKYYGGRGIKVCKRWEDSFEDFYKDMGAIPKGMTLERIDNDGNYEPDNCKWATQEEQHNNNSRNIVLKYNGISLNMVQWARKLGISRACLWDRINRELPINAIFTSRKFKACEAINIIENKC